MSSVSSDTSPLSSRRNPLRNGASVIAKAASRAIRLYKKEHAFELPARLFEQVPFGEPQPRTSYVANVLLKRQQARKVR